jgi:hypothetical protein
MRTLLFSMTTLLAMVAFTSCVSVNKTVPVVQFYPLQIEPLNPTQYEILGDVEGVGTSTGVLFLNTGIKFGGGEAGVVGIAKAKATYDALSKHEGADAIIAPRYDIQTFSFPIFFRKATVKMKGKAIRIKK